MPYATAAQLENAIGTEAFLRVVDRDDDGQVDATAVDEALDSASSFADSYIATFLPMPDPPPDALAKAVAWIAWYYLAGESFTTYQRQRYEDAVRWLEHVQAGKATLGIPPVTSSPSSAGSVVLASQPRLMTRESLGRLL